MKPTAARAVVATAFKPLPGCPKREEPCIAGFYPHCAACDTTERAIARRVDELLAQLGAAVERARVEGVDVATVRLGEEEREEVRELIAMTRERCYRRVDDIALRFLELHVEDFAEE